MARPDRCDVEELLAEPDTPPGALVALCRVAGGTVARDRSPRCASSAGVQDEGSQLIVLAVLSPLSSARIHGGWIMCGARREGGPAGGSGGSSGLPLVAVEPREARARLVEKALAGSRGDHPGGGRRRSGRTVVTGEFRSGAGRCTPARPSGAQAPSESLAGSPEDVAELARLQQELLLAAVAAARPGGIIGYATCSRTSRRRTWSSTTVLARRNDLTEESAVALLPDIPDTGPGPRLRLWPHRHGTDGMFLSILRRTL